MRLLRFPLHRRSSRKKESNQYQKPLEIELDEVLREVTQGDNIASENLQIAKHKSETDFMYDTSGGRKDGYFIGL